MIGLIKALGWFFMAFLSALLYVPLALFVWVFDR